jgi:hypothetical protein
MDTSNKDVSHTLYMYYPGFWFHLLFKVTEVKLSNFYDLLQHLNYRADLHQIFIMDTSNKAISHISRVFDFTCFSRSQRSNFQIFTICSNTLTIGWIFTKFLSWIHLIRIYYPGFWFHVLFKVTEVKLSNLYDLLQHLSYQADLHPIFIMDTSNKDISHITWIFYFTHLHITRYQVCDLTYF